MLLNFNDSGMDLDTKIMGLYEKSQIFMEKYPEIRSALEHDLDSHGLQKKATRTANKAFEERKSIESGEALFDPTEYQADDEAPRLKQGRPRLPADLVFFFMAVRGLWGSVSGQDETERINDSISIQAVLSYHGHKTPGANTIRENINKVSPTTRQLIFRCQALYILENELDDFNEVYVDSTHVKANTSFPTDLGIILKLLKRVLGSLRALEKFGIEAAIKSWTLTRLEKMEKHFKHVSMNSGKGLKGKVKEEFKMFLSLTSRVVSDLTESRDLLTPLWEAAALNPQRRYALDMLWDMIEQDLCDAAYVRHYTIQRVEAGVKTSTSEMILSVSDPDAAYIQKGQRVPVIGYRPQIARSRQGFICGCLTPRGNASDSNMLIPTVEHVRATTGFAPELVSTDDGYASGFNVDHLKDVIGVARVSVGGAKGKKILDDDLWDNPFYIEARTQRSAVESGMFTLKFNHGFGELRRRGIDAVAAENMEKVIAYNFIHIIRKEKRKHKEQEELASWRLPIAC
jgi:hypothetical protein